MMSSTVLQQLGDRPPSILVCEHHRARELPDRLGALRRTREARYGQTTLSFYTATKEGG